MKIFKITTLPILLVLLFCFSCQNGPGEAEGALAHIPATATSVAAIDMERMMQKADFEEVKSMEFYQNMIASASRNNPAIAEALRDPRLSGIDLTGRIYFTTDVDKDDPKKMITHLIIPLNSVEDFEKMIAEARVNYKKSGKVKIFNPKDGPLLSWSDDLLILTLANPDETDPESRVIAMYDLPREESVTRNRTFRKAMKGDHDLTVWFSTDEIARNPAAGLAMSFIDVDADALKGNYIYSYADFENGRMAGHADFDLNRSLSRDFIGRFFNEKIRSDFSEVLPSENLAFAMTTAINPRGIDRFLSERPQSKEYADFVLNDLGVKRKDLLEIFGGDMMVAIYGADNIRDGSFLIAANTKNEAKVKDWLQRAVEEKKLKEVEPGYYKVVTIGSENFTITVNKGLGKLLHQNGMLIFSTDNTLLEKIRKGEVMANAGKDFTQHFDDQMVAGWFNLPVLQNTLGGANGKDMEMMKFNINEDGADFIMETGDPETNSLKTLMRMMNKAYLERELKGQEVM